VVNIYYPQDNYSHIQVYNLSPRAVNDVILLYVNGIRLTPSDIALPLDINSNKHRKCSIGHDSTTPALNQPPLAPPTWRGILEGNRYNDEMFNRSPHRKFYNYSLLIENDVLEREFDLVVNGRSNKVRLAIPHETIITSPSHNEVIDPRGVITLEWEIARNSQRQGVALVSFNNDFSDFNDLSFYFRDVSRSQRSYTFQANSVLLLENVYISVSNVNRKDRGRVAFTSESFDRRLYQFTDTENEEI